MSVGYLGLGVMGYGMASNLMKKMDEPILGYDPVYSARERFASLGGTVTSSAEELYRACDIICECLPTNDIARKTISEIIEVANPGTLIIDLGSTSPEIIRELYPVALEKGIHLLDSPVSGGKTGADSGTLVIMCGGDKESFEKAKPYLEMMGKTVTYMGPTGCGSIAKLANNIMVGIHLLSMGEAFAFAKKAGLDVNVLFDAIKGGFAQSAVMDLKAPKVLQRDFSATARIAVHFKDINNAISLADSIGAELPMTKIVHEQMVWMKENDMIDEDQCALVKYYENLMGVEIK